MESYSDPYEGLRNKLVAVADATLPFSQSVTRTLVQHKAQVALGFPNCYHPFAAEIEHPQFAHDVHTIYYTKTTLPEIQRFLRQIDRFFDRNANVLLYEFNVPDLPSTRADDRDLYALEQTTLPYIKLARAMSDRIAPDEATNSKIILVSPLNDHGVISHDAELALAAALKGRELLEREYGKKGIRFLNFTRGYSPLEEEVTELIQNYVLNPSARQ